MSHSASHAISRAHAPDLTGALRQTLSFLGRQGVVLGFFAVAIVFVAAHAVGQAPSAALLLAAFLLVLPSYGIDRIADAAADAASYPDRAAFYQRRRRGLVLFYALVLVAALGAGASTGRIAPVLGVLAFPLSVVFYSLPVAPVGWRFRRAKDLPYAKGVYTGLCWAGLVPLAAVFVGAPGSSTLTALAAYVFVVLWITTVVCDLKDVESDRRVGVRTLPTALGLAGTVRVLEHVNLGGAVAVLAAAAFGILPSFLAAVATGHALLTDLYLARLERPGTDLRFYGDVVSDGVAIAWIPLTLVARAFLG